MNKDIKEPIEIHLVWSQAKSDVAKLDMDIDMAARSMWGFVDEIWRSQIRVDNILSRKVYRQIKERLRGCEIEDSRRGMCGIAL